MAVRVEGRGEFTRVGRDQMMFDLRAEVLVPGERHLREQRAAADHGIVHDDVE